MEKQYYSYIRVSTIRQGERGVSLQEQQDAIQRYAQRQNLQIIRLFEEQETAAKRGRPVFGEMLRLLKRGRAHGVIIHKIDRGARNLKDWADLAELIDAGVEVHFANESLDMNTRGGRLSADIQAVVAADFIRNLREETKKGFYGRLKQGLYPLGAPTGYLDCGKGQPKAPDPEMAPLVLLAFQLYATGNYSLPRLMEEMHKRGLRSRRNCKVSLNGISTILNNPFYVGIIKLRKSGEIFSGVHLPIVGKSLYDTVQQILEGKTVVRTHKHNFAFSRMLHCRLCGCTLMAELQKGHTYYRCHTPKCGTKTIREERFYAALADAFKPLQLSKAEITCAQRWFVRSRLNQGEHQKEEIERYQLNLAQLRDRLMRLTDAYLDGVLDKSLLEERRNVLLMEEAGMKQKIADLEAGCSDTLIRVEKFLELVKSASNLDNLAIPEEKRVLAKKLTSNLGIGPKNVAITLNAEAQEIANRSQLLCSSPNRGVPRTWDTLLTRLVNMFNEKQAA
jgi:DNA invertase Pin-like site-specific DNA recombinase